MLSRLLFILSICYAVSVGGVLAAMEWWGERSWILSLALFAPPWLLLGPLLILIPWAVLAWRWRLVALHACCAAFVLFVYMGFRWTSRPKETPATLKVVTHNVGQGNKLQFRSFLEQEQPDVALLQDAKYRGRPYARLYPDHHVVARGEFICISRYPIQEATLLEKPNWKGKPVAARFEVLVEGKAVAFYNVHLPTPRPQFNRILSRRLLTQLFGEEENGTNYRAWIESRIKLGQELAERIASESAPYIAAGDFNMPDHGFIYHQFAGRMTDCFTEAGRGWGMTFPGGVRNPLGYLTPWLRIDFVFAGKGWNPVFCEAEPGRRSQHRAVLAILTPSETP